MVIIYGVVLKEANDKRLPIKQDPNLAKLLLFTLCFGLNVGGVSSSVHRRLFGRNAIMMGILIIKSFKKNLILFKSKKSYLL